MRKRKMLIFSIVFMLVISTCCSVLLLLARHNRSTLRKLSQREIRPILKRITGRDLPSKSEELRAILYSYHGLEDIFVAFRTDEEGCSYVLDEFGSGQDIMRQEFPHKEYNHLRYSMVTFLNGYLFQKKLGIDLFDKDLIERIKHEHLEYVNMNSYPKDAVNGYYLKFSESSKLAFYRILVFKDLNIVYIFAEKKTKGFRSR